MDVKIRVRNDRQLRLEAAVQHTEARLISLRLELFNRRGERKKKALWMVNVPVHLPAADGWLSGFLLQLSGPREEDEEEEEAGKKEESG